MVEVHRRDLEAALLLLRFNNEVIHQAYASEQADVKTAPLPPGNYRWKTGSIRAHHTKRAKVPLIKSQGEDKYLFMRFWD